MKLLRAEQVAAILQIPRARAYELAREGIIPSTRIGRLVRFDEDALRAWINQGGTLLPDNDDKASPSTRPNVPAKSGRGGGEGT